MRPASAGAKRCYYMNFEKSIKKDFLSANFKVIQEDYLASKNGYFPYYGTQVFCGMQGQGKTISAVKCVLDIKKEYPKCIVVTNLKLNVDWEYIEFKTSDDLAKVLTDVNNGMDGVIYLIDEIHTYFNSLDSKNIPSYIFTEISQQRKQRKVIIGTSQLYLRLAKPFREQCDTLIMCRTFFGKYTLNKAYRGDTIEEVDGKVLGNLLKLGFFMQSPALRNAYDTYQKVVSAKEIYEDSNVISFNKKSFQKAFK